MRNEIYFGQLCNIMKNLYLLRQLLNILIRWLYFYLFLFFLTISSIAQPIAVNFLSPDTVCVGDAIDISNLTTGGSTYYWSFCTGNTSYDPIGINIGNPGNLLNIPTYIALVKDGNTCYSFIPCQGNQSLIRYNHGNSFSNNPISWTNLGNFGILGDDVMGIRIRYDNGQWIGFINNTDQICRLEFGSSPGNTPTATVLGPYAMLNTPHCLEILKENDTWIGLITCSWGNKLVRLNFGTSLLNEPVLTDLGTPGNLYLPGPFFLVQENGDWYSFHVNLGNNTHSRLYFGNSLLNNPTGVNLGNVCGTFNLGGILLIRDCDTTNGFQLNYSASPAPDLIWRLNFPQGITGPVTCTSMGNIGNLNRPSQFSEVFRIGDTLFLYITNRQNFTLTRLRFLPCSNATIPSSTLYNPPPFSYNQPGTYNVQLIVNEGQANQASLCKNVVVMPPPVVTLGSDRIICPGTSTTLNAGTGFSGYLWSTGATTPSISVGQPGAYWVKVTKYGCDAYDTVNVTLFPVQPLSIGEDTAICQGLTYTFNAGNCPGCSFVWSNLSTGQPNIGTGPSYTTDSTGNYMVTRTDANGCLNRDTASLFIVPLPIITTFPLTQTICSSTFTNILLSANIPGTSFSWTASGSHPSITGYSNGTGSSIQQQLFNTSSSIGYVTYSIQPSAYECAGETSEFIVYVNPLPDLSISALSQTICSGESTYISLSSLLQGTTFTWTATASSSFLSGYENGSGNMIEQTIFNAGTSNEWVKFVVTPTANGCTGLSDSIEMVIKPLPSTIFEPDHVEMCTGTTTTILLSSPVSSATFYWTATGSSPAVSGFLNGSGTLIMPTLFNSSSHEEQVTYVVSPTANGCAGNDSSFIVTVFPVPDVVFTPTTQTICSGDSTNLSLSSGVSGATFSWTATASSPLVSGYSAGNGYQIVQSLFYNGILPETVTYLVIPEINQCEGISGVVSVTVSPAPQVMLHFCHDTITTIQSKPITLRGGIPLNGYYSGQGIANNILYPSLSGVGTHLITYSYTNTFGCESYDSSTITIFPSITHTCGEPVTDIRDGQSYPTVQIGSQCWIARNLNYGIHTPSANLQTDNCIPEKFCYRELSSHCQTYGGLYQWDEMMAYSTAENGQGLCPPGWHIPSEADWDLVFNQYINNAFAASPLLYSGYSGYNALLSGCRFIDRIWDFDGFATLFWTSTSHGPFKAWAHGMNDYNHGISFYPAFRLNAFSVRCIRD